MEARVNTDEVELRHLKVFVHVIEQGSFGAAARSIGVSQPAISQTLSHLERRLGGRLVERSRPARPTPLGSRILHHARATLRVAKALEEDILSSTRRLTIGVPASWAFVLPSWIQALVSHDTSLRPHTHIYDVASLRCFLSQGKLDAAIIPGEKVLPGESSVPLVHGRLVMAYTPSVAGFLDISHDTSTTTVWTDDEYLSELVVKDPTVGPMFKDRGPCVSAGYALNVARKTGGVAVVYEERLTNEQILHSIAPDHKMHLVSWEHADQDCLCTLFDVVTTSSGGI